MVTWFVDAGSGNNANDGRDNIGVNLSGTVTWTEATFTITEAAGHGYTFSPGDVIYIDGGTGATVGLYEVSSSTSTTISLEKTSDLPTVKNADDFAAGDLATGDITSSDGPYLTMDFTQAGLGQADHVWVRGGTSYFETYDIDTFQATWNTPVIYEGYTTTLGDDGQATIDGGASRPSGIVESGLAGNTNYVFKNFIITNHEADGVDLNDVDRFTWKNCDFIANGNFNGPGITAGLLHVFENCRFNDNGGDGVACQGGAVFIGCEFMRNDVAGIDGSGATFAIDCIFFSNAGPAFDVGAANDVITLAINCTFDGDGNDTNTAVNINTTFRAMGAVVNCIVYDCTTGIKFDNGEQMISRNNLLFDNGANYFGTNAGTFDGEILSAPDFVDEVAGADFSLNSGSPAVEAGFDAYLTQGSTQAKDMGAVQRPPSGAGGGLLMPNKRAGKQ